MELKHCTWIWFYKAIFHAYKTAVVQLTGNVIIVHQKNENMGNFGQDFNIKHQGAYPIKLINKYTL